MQKARKDKPAVRPDKKVCDACSNHGMCCAEVGFINYECPKIATSQRKD